MGRPRRLRPTSAAAYFYSSDRKGEHPRGHLARFAGHLHADAGFGELYDPARRPAPLVEVACWAHARRRLYDVWQADDRSAAGAGLDLIRALYDAEAAARGKPPDERLELRRSSRAAVDAFFVWAEATLARVSAESALAEALRYATKRRDALSRFLADARLEADDNRAENALRAVALGRRNWTFAGSDAGGERAAAIYTLTQTARLNGLDPERYPTDVLTKIGALSPFGDITYVDGPGTQPHSSRPECGRFVSAGSAVRHCWGYPVGRTLMSGLLTRPQPLAMVGVRLRARRRSP